MKRLLFVFVLVLVSISTMEIARAAEPYVFLSVPQKKVNLGSVFMYDTIIPEAMTLKVNSNCFHGPIIASISSLKNSLGKEIGQDSIFIKTPFTGDFISMSKPVVISEPASGSHDIVIDFKVQLNGVFYRAGRFNGTIAFTVMPPV